MATPKLMPVSTAVDYAELSAVITVGPETAAELSKKLGRKVEPGEQFDIGTLAVYHKNWFKRTWETLKIKKNIFND